MNFSFTTFITKSKKQSGCLGLFLAPNTALAAGQWIHLPGLDHKKAAWEWHQVAWLRQPCLKQLTTRGSWHSPSNMGSENMFAWICCNYFDLQITEKHLHYQLQPESPHHTLWWNYSHCLCSDPSLLDHHQLPSPSPKGQCLLSPSSLSLPPFSLLHSTALQGKGTSEKELWISCLKNVLLKTQMMLFCSPYPLVASRMTKEKAKSEWQLIWCHLSHFLP